MSVGAVCEGRFRASSLQPVAELRLKVPEVLDPRKWPDELAQSRRMQPQSTGMTRVRNTEGSQGGCLLREWQSTPLVSYRHGEAADELGTLSQSVQ